MGIKRGLWFKIVDEFSDILNNVKLLWGDVDSVSSDLKEPC